MRWNEQLQEKIYNRIQTGWLIGDEGAPNGRVTVEPAWQLRTTSPVYANSTRGPYRYWHDEKRVEYEIPAVQSISISRPQGQDFGTCTITIYNYWHEANLDQPEMAGQFGKPGYFWPKRGVTDLGDPSDSAATWNQSPGTGAYKRLPPTHPDYDTEDGQWDANFSWRNVLVDDAMIRTYQGYGGNTKDSNQVYTKINQNIDDGHIVPTGVWLVDSVIGNSAGTLILQCRDVGRLMLDQIVFPPTIPSALYPLEYVPPGRSAFNSTWGPLGRAPSSAAGSMGPVRIIPTATSYGWTAGGGFSGVSGDDFLQDHPIQAAIDGDQRDFYLTEAFDKRFQYPDAAFPDYSDTAWVEIEPLRYPDPDYPNETQFSMLEITPWAGGYKVYVSVMVDGAWVQGEHKSDQDEPEVVPSVTPTEQIEYVSKAYIPETNPGGDAQRGEQAIFINLNRKLSGIEAAYANFNYSPEERGRLYGTKEQVQEGEYVQFLNVEKIRISFQRFYYSGMPNNAGDQFRAGIRTLKAFCYGQNNNPYSSDIRDVSLNWNIAAHPVRGYWVQENPGTVHGFGDAYFDSDSLGGGGNIFADPLGLLQNSQIRDRDVPITKQNVNRWYPRMETYAFRPPQPINGNTGWDAGIGIEITNQNRAYGLAAHPGGESYWVMDHFGNVNAFHDPNDPRPKAQYYGSFSLADAYMHGDPERLYDMFGNAYVGPDRFSDWRAGQPNLYPNRTPLGYTDPVTGNFVCQTRSDTNAKAFFTDIAATPTGNGYWTIRSDGAIFAFGDARGSLTKMNGETITPTVLSSYDDISEETWTFDKYVIPDTPETIKMDDIWKWYFGYGRVSYGYSKDYQRSGKAKAIAAHPTKIGCWVSDESGQVFSFGDGTHDVPGGQTGLIGRVYNPGGQNEFSLKLFDRVASMEATDTGRGYWILFNSGMVAAFGDAVDKGPVDLDSINKEFEDNVAVKGRYDSQYYAKLFYGLARDQDGRGYWTLRADGEVYFYESTDWGNPGWHNLTGYRWHEGNFTGDWANIAKEVAMWAGFTFYNREKDDPSLLTLDDFAGTPEEKAAALKEHEKLYILGNLESTAIEADVEITGDKWDKKAIIDILRELSEVTGYVVRIDQEGGLRYESPNWWRSGNFDYEGNRIWVIEPIEGSGVYLRVSDLEANPSAFPFIPEIHETVDMMAHSATLSNADKKWQIIIGTDTPDPRDIERTSHVQHFPPFSNYELSPGVPAMRGIPRTSIWTSHVFENAEERQLMAEMIGIHNYFAARTATTTAVANPCLDLQDQVRLVERTTGETYIHRILGINTEMNLEDGTYTMDLQTHWLGSARDWVLVTTAEGEPWDVAEEYTAGNRVSYGGTSYIALTNNVGLQPDSNPASWSPQEQVDNPMVVISDRLDSWQTQTQRELQVSGYAENNPYIMDLTGEFATMTSAIDNDGDPRWGLWYTGTSVEVTGDTILTPTGDVLEMSTNGSVFPFVNYKSFGQGADTGLNWPFLEGNSGNGYSYEDGGTEYAAARSRNSGQSFILTLGSTPEHLTASEVIVHDVTATTATDGATFGAPGVEALAIGATVQTDLTPTPPDPFVGVFETDPDPATPVSAFAFLADPVTTFSPVGDPNTYDAELSGVTLTDVIVDVGGMTDVTLMLGFSDGWNDWVPLASKTITGAGASNWEEPEYAPHIFTAAAGANLDPVTIELQIDMLEVLEYPNPGRLVFVCVPTGPGPTYVRPDWVEVGSVEFHYTEVTEITDNSTPPIDAVTLPTQALPAADVVALDAIPAYSGGWTVQFGDGGVLDQPGSGATWVWPAAAPSSGYVLRGVRLDNVSVDPGTGPTAANDSLIGIGFPDSQGASLPGSGRANNDAATPVDPDENTWVDGANAAADYPPEGINNASVAGFAAAPPQPVDSITLYVDNPNPTLVEGAVRQLGIGTFALNPRSNGGDPILFDSVSFDSITWLWYLPRN